MKKEANYIMVKGHRIEKEITTKHFLETVTNYNRKQALCTKHAFFRLNEKQREIFTCEKIRDYLFQDTLSYVGIQYNSCYAVIYEYRKKNFIRIILNISRIRIDIVTFYIIEGHQIPKLK